MLTIENEVIAEKHKGLSEYFSEMPNGLFYINKYQEEVKIIRKGHEDYFKSDGILANYLNEFWKYLKDLNRKNEKFGFELEKDFIIQSTKIF